MSDIVTTNMKSENLEENRLSSISESNCETNEKAISDTENFESYEPDIHDSNIKEEIGGNEATEDESMAVEALWQLGGGGYNDKENSEDNTVEETQSESVQYPVIKSIYSLLQCESCSLCFPTDSDFQAHRSTCEGNIEDSFTCGICSVKFDKKDNYLNHMICHEVDRPFSCRSCGLLFKQKNEFQQHTCLRKQIDLMCKICGLEFTRKSSLTNHLKIHLYTPGKALLESVISIAETALPESRESTWPHDNQPLPPLMPQLEIQSAPYYNQSSDMPNWNLNLSLNDTITEDLPDSMDIAQEMIINTTYSGVLDSQSSAFSGEFDNIDNSDSLDYESRSISPKSERIPCNQSESEDVPVKVETLHIPTEDKLVKNPSRPELEEDVLIKKTPYICRYCGATFTRAKPLESHERFHQDYLSDFLECKKCGDVFMDKGGQKNHICSANFIEKNCSNVTKSPIGKMTTIKPVEIQSSTNRLQPNEPDEYSTEEGLEEESISSSLLAKVKQNKHACEHCSKRFATKQKMFRHMWIHRNKTFSCEVCGDTFSLQNELDEHRLKLHGGNTPHGCALCGKCFASRQGLWEHARSHREGAAPHRCTLCGKHFASRQGYLIHTRTHTGERPYGCRYCWKAFRDGGTLRKHERIHTGERPHVCPLCHRAFNQKVVLREHVRWVHAQAVPAEPPLNCPLCPQVLTDKEDLCAHIVKHSDLLSTRDKPKPSNKSNIDKSAQQSVKLNIKRDLYPLETDPPKSEVQNHFLYTSNMDCLTPMGSPEDPSNSTCDMCGDVFPSRELLLSHVKIHI